MRSERDLTTQMGVFGIVIPAGIEGTALKCSISSDWVFMTKLFKNEALVSNLRANDKARNIGGIDGSQSGMSTEKIFDIP